MKVVVRLGERNTMFFVGSATTATRLKNFAGWPLMCSTRVVSRPHTWCEVHCESQQQRFAWPSWRNRRPSGRNRGSPCTACPGSDERGRPSGHHVPVLATAVAGEPDCRCQRRGQCQGGVRQAGDRRGTFRGQFRGGSRSFDLLGTRISPQPEVLTDPPNASLAGSASRRRRVPST